MFLKKDIQKQIARDSTKVLLNDFMTNIGLVFQSNFNSISFTLSNLCEKIFHQIKLFLFYFRKHIIYIEYLLFLKIHNRNEKQEVS